MKVKVSDEVAEVLVDIGFRVHSVSELGDIWDFIYDFIGETSVEFRKRNNISYELLQNIYENGWEVREFQVGDLVSNNNSQSHNLDHIQEVRQENIDYIKKYCHTFTLVYKAENREDLKNE